MKEEGKEDNLRGMIKKEYNKCILLDIFCSDIEEAEYCLYIRTYDLIFINYRDINRKKYYNLLKTISRFYKLKNKIYILSEPKEKGEFKLFRQQQIKNFGELKINFLDYLNEKELFKIISSVSEDYLTDIPLINNLEIDHDKKQLIINLEDKIVLSIKRDIDFQVLVYFIRHYEEIINIDSLLSAITTEPEVMHNSPIETSISSIRKIFKKAFDTNPIKAFKKVGYRFAIYEKAILK